jgi:hypothetical protein
MTEQHVHTSRCYEWLLACGKFEHSHGAKCYNKDGALTCSYYEHDHTGACDKQYLQCGK